MNSKKETNGRVKMGQGSRWATVVYPVKESNNSEQQERSKLQGQIEPKVKMSQGSRWTTVVYPLKESNNSEQ